MGERHAASVLIIDDHPLLRDAVETALTRAADGAARATHAASLADALAALETNDFCLAFLDLTLSDASNFDGLIKLQAVRPNLPVVIVSATENPEAIRRAQRLGATGYLPKSLGLADMTAAITAALEGRGWFPALPNEAETVGEDPASRVASLTPAQRRVLDGLSEGLLNKQIAYEMGISQATVKAHMTAIFRKLGVGNRTQALLALKAGASAGGHGGV